MLGDSGKEILSMLENLKNVVKEKPQEAEKSFEDIEEKWEKKQDKLAYFIEHNELEKVDNNLVSLKSYISIKNFDEVIKEIDETAFSVKHIEEKYQFNLKNIF